MSTLVVKDVTPQEAWSGVKPSIENFKVFGCIAHVHVPNVRRSKLDNKSFTCVLLGVSEESKGCRLYDPVAKKVVVSRDVIFKEKKQWDWDVSYEEHISIDLEWGDDDREMNESGEGVNDNGHEVNVEGEEDDSSLSSEENGEHEGRVRQPLVWMHDYVSGEGLSEDEANMVHVESDDLLYFEEAMKNSKWRLAMDCEIKSIEKNKTWIFIELSIGAKKIGVKWVYKTKSQGMFGC